MRQTMKLWMLAAILICCTSGVASCGNDDDAAIVTSAAKEHFTLWNQCEALTALQEYVEDVTNPNSKNFIREEDCVATFDMDGTPGRETATADPSAITIKQV